MNLTHNDTADHLRSPFGFVNGAVLEESNRVARRGVVSLPLGSGFYPQILEGNATEVTGKHQNSPIKKSPTAKGGPPSTLGTGRYFAGTSGSPIDAAWIATRTGTGHRSNINRGLKCFLE